MIRRVRTVDVHVAGQVLRLIADGFPSPEGVTMFEKETFLRRSQDQLRCALMQEPRGHSGMSGALLTESVSDGADAGMIFMHSGGYSSMSGQGVIGGVTVALEYGLLQLSDPTREIVLDTVAGVVHAKALPPGPARFDRIASSFGVERQLSRSSRFVESVSFRNVPSFVLQGGVEVEINGRPFLVDVAFGGEFFAITDAESAGVQIRRDQLHELRTLNALIKDSVERLVDVVHPTDSRVRGLCGTIFTGVAEQAGADLRSVTVFSGDHIDRSPCCTATAAVMSVLDEMDVLGIGQQFRQEGILGTSICGTVESREAVGDRLAIVPRIEDSAWVIGEHEFLIDDSDPSVKGFLL